MKTPGESGRFHVCRSAVEGAAAAVLMDAVTVTISRVADAAATVQHHLACELRTAIVGTVGKAAVAGRAAPETVEAHGTAAEATPAQLAAGIQPLVAQDVTGPLWLAQLARIQEHQQAVAPASVAGEPVVAAADGYRHLAAERAVPGMTQHAVDLEHGAARFHAADEFLQGSAAGGEHDRQDGDDGQQFDERESPCPHVASSLTRNEKPDLFPGARSSSIGQTGITSRQGWLHIL